MAKIGAGVSSWALLLHSSLALALSVSKAIFNNDSKPNFSYSGLPMADASNQHSRSSSSARTIPTSISKQPIPRSRWAGSTAIQLSAVFHVSGWFHLFSLPSFTRIVHFEEENRCSTYSNGAVSSSLRGACTPDSVSIRKNSGIRLRATMAPSTLECLLRKDLLSKSPTERNRLPCL